MLLSRATLSRREGEIIYSIYTKYKRRLLYVAHSYVGDQAEDIVHDMFVFLTKKFENKMEELCDKREYYFVTIVKNRAIDLLRKELLTNAVELDDYTSVFADEETNPAHRAQVQGEVDWMLKCMDDLKPIYRQVLEYKYLLEYTNVEIADEMHISINLVSTRVQRALQQLRDRFHQEDAYERRAL